jgi:hypothetical protein
MEISRSSPPRYRSRTGLALRFLAIVGVFLATEHRAHRLGMLPYDTHALAPCWHGLAQPGPRGGIRTW